jgi:AcrR family transcriptional regulator
MVDRSPKGLTRDAVVAAALQLVEQQGSGALTMRAVAARLGVSPMAVYNHTSDRDDLLLGMLEQTVAGVPTDPGTGEPPARIARLFQGMHDHLARHRWALEVLVRGDLVPVSSFAFADASIAVFLAAGLSPADAIYAHGVCWHLALGEIFDRHPEPPATTPTQRETALRTMDPKEYPNYAHVIQVLDPMDAPPSCQFPRSLSLLLRGLLPALQA